MYSILALGYLIDLWQYGRVSLMGTINIHILANLRMHITILRKVCLLDYYSWIIKSLSIIRPYYRNQTDK